MELVVMATYSKGYKYFVWFRECREADLFFGPEIYRDCESLLF